MGKATELSSTESKEPFVSATCHEKNQASENMTEEKLFMMTVNDFPQRENSNF